MGGGGGVNDGKREGKERWGGNQPSPGLSHGILGSFLMEI